MKKVKDYLFFNNLLKNWKGILLILIVLYILQRDYNLFSKFIGIFNFCSTSHSKIDTAKITDWLQAIGGIGSAIIAFFVIVITNKFNKFTENQSAIALEEFRPIIVPDRENGTLLLKNQGTNEALDLDYFISTNTGENNFIKINKLGENLIIPPNGHKKIEILNGGYHSIIYKYKNSISGIYYIGGFNRFDGNNFLAIGEKNGSYESPLKKEDFQNFYNSVSVKNQIINSIDFENDFENYLKIL
ncbi:hypothetical protein M0P65_01535 [Candidatus Gracilibacteria bacterium]|nr:hypothetical protein [Candidatus Gracilibacteria bacterium]